MTCQQPFEFGEWRVDPTRGTLSADGREVPLEPNLMDLLVLFSGTGGRMPSKDEVLEAVWAGRAIGAHTLAAAVSPRRRPLAETAAGLMRSKTARLYHDHMLTKEPGTRQATPWHQDQPYYNIEGRQNASFWIPVDPVSRESTLELIAGSHLGPWLMPRTFMEHQAKWFPEGTLADLPNIDAARATFPILGWEMQPGDAVCFHMLMLHGARGVTGPNRRRVFSVRFLGDDIRHAPRRWKTSPEFPGLSAELAAGAPMNHALFPVLWSSPP